MFLKPYQPATKLLCPLLRTHQTKPWKPSIAKAHSPSVSFFFFFNKCGIGSNNNYGKMWLICRRHAGVFFLTYSFSFFHFSSILFSPLPLQTLIIASKSADSAPAEAMAVKDNVCMCVRFLERHWRCRCIEIFGRQRGLTQSRHEAPQWRKLWCVHTCVDPDWPLTIQLTAALKAWQREANRYLEQTGEIWGTAAAHMRAGCNLTLNSTRGMETCLRCSRWDFDGHHWWILGRAQQVCAPEESRPHVCTALRQGECVCAAWLCLEWAQARGAQSTECHHQSCRRAKQ